MTSSMEFTTVRINHLDGRPWSSCGFSDPASHAMAWAIDRIAEKFEVDYAAVDFEEGDDGRELITVNGKPVMEIA